MIKLTRKKANNSEAELRGALTSSTGTVYSAPRFFRSRTRMLESLADEIHNLTSSDRPAETITGVTTRA